MKSIRFLKKKAVVGSIFLVLGLVSCSQQPGTDNKVLDSLEFTGKTGLVFAREGTKGEFLSSSCRFFDVQTKKSKQIKGRHCTPYGDNFLIVREGKLSLISKTKKKIWTNQKYIIHHGISVAPNGNIYALSNDLHAYKDEMVLFDTILVLTPKGKLIQKWSSFKDLAKNKKYLTERTHRLDRKKYKLKQTRVGRYFRHNQKEANDVYHRISSIQVLQESFHENENPHFRKGNILVSFNLENFVAILDSESFEIVWTFYPYKLFNRKLYKIYSANLTKQGNALLFLNGVDYRNRSKSGSQIVELNPISKKIIWRFPLIPNTKYFSNSFGSVQKLESGNYLISDFFEGEFARSFEITPSHQLEWLWFEPKGITRDRFFENVKQFRGNKLLSYFE